MIEYILKNKEWIFSGIGVPLIVYILNIINKTRNKDNNRNIENLGNNNLKAKNINFNQTINNSSKMENTKKVIENKELRKLKNELLGEDNTVRNYLFVLLGKVRLNNESIEVNNVLDIAEDEKRWRPDFTLSELKKLEEEGVIKFKTDIQDIVSPYDSIRLTPTYFEYIK